MHNIDRSINQGTVSPMIIVPQSKAKVNEKGGKNMKVIVKRIPCRKKPAPNAVEQAKADILDAHVVCIPIDMKRMLRNAQNRQAK